MPLRIGLVSPPTGYAFSLQRGKAERVDTQISRGTDLWFDLTMDAEEGKTAGTTNFLGPFAQGKPTDRFFYLVVASERSQEMCGRVKVPVHAVLWKLARQVADDPSNPLVASYEAANSKGGPTLASVKLLGDGWSAATSAST